MNKDGQRGKKKQLKKINREHVQEILGLFGCEERGQGHRHVGIIREET